MKNQKDTIHSLVEKFQHNLNEYKNPKYGETHIRVEFVNPFWEALGWDVLNTSGYAMGFRDVIHEDEVKVGGTTKAPDYSFRIGGKRIFFMETKKPSIDLKHDPAPAFQLRRYAYSARLPVSLLTDFEEFILYDTRVKPAITDKPHVGRMLYFTFDEYLDHWDEIQAIFSKEAVMRGDFQRFIENNQGKKARAEIDRDFLNDLDNWRVQLARNIALRNPGLTERELNYTVQLTIDRLIFLRMCEDRGIESQYPLRAIQNGENLYPRLVEIYYRADERYNSGLFHFEAKDGANPDTITPRLKMDDKILKEILAYLYYPKCPYEFSVLPVEVLGNAYEQFLGKRITLTEGHRARIEEKPEVRKAGGVYYTPQYIVEYIVRNTVGKLVEGKTPKEVSELRICDPACGSGSFLLGAYQFLLDWHLEQYRIEFEATDQLPSSPPTKGQRARKSDPQAMYQGAGGAWYLSTTEKKRILLNNIYGVDIDSNAVEVSKLSLLLKVLEGENAETLHSQMKLWHERALPNLSSNIKCGNSLIGPDFYEHQQASLFDENEAMRINAFDWEREFSDVFANGGFDAVVGNPPYGAIIKKIELDYLLNKFQNSKKFPDSYCLFIENLKLLTKINGYCSFIVPNTFCDLESCNTFRKWLLKELPILSIWQTGWAFRDAIVDTIVFVSENSILKNDYAIKISIEETEYKRSTASFIENELSKIDFRNRIEEKKLVNKVLPNSDKLGDLCIVKAGVKMYEKGKGQPAQTEKTMKERPYSCKGDCPDGWRPLYRGGDIKRYFINGPNEYVNYGPWLAAPRNEELFKSPKIIMRRTDDKINSSIEYYNSICVNSCHVIKFKESDYYSYEFLLGIINSKLTQKIFSLMNPQMVGKVFAEIKVIYVERFPICKINLKNKKDKAIYDGIVAFVMQILDLHKKLVGVREPRTREMLQRQIDAVDAQIDKLVYVLYGLTEEEVRVVEG